MELLPIIYLSLAIFSVVAVATIITSFVTYKIRSKTEGYIKPYEKEDDPLNQNYMKRKVMDSDGKFHTVISEKDKSKPKSQNKHESKKRIEKPKEAASSKDKTRSTQSRIKIINTPTNNKPASKPPLKVKSEKEITNIKENILNKYTEDAKEEFYSPKVAIKKDKSK